jgi:hypothetical protein
MNAESIPVATLDGKYASGGRRLPVREDGPKVKFMHLHFIGDNSIDHRFASCLCCWKTGVRKFDDAEVTPYPSDCAIDKPRLKMWLHGLQLLCFGNGT